MKLRFTLALFTLLNTFAFTQHAANPWTNAEETSIDQENLERRIVPQTYRTLALDQHALDELLAIAPMWFSGETGLPKPMLSIPMPDGHFQQFTIVEAPVMHPDLCARYPAIKSYAGWSKEDPTAYLRFGVTQKGFHGMILSARHSSVFIDNYAVGDTEHYISYYKKDYQDPHSFQCLTKEPAVDPSWEDPVILKSFAGDCTHRTYALALACTGEYAQYHGGTKSSVMAEFNVAMTRINGIYEREVGVTMVLIANNDDLIFLNAGTDPYTNNNGGTMLSENQTTIDNIIGAANYGIGHVFSTGGGGVANLRSVCRPGFKARGVTGLSNPVGDPFYVDYVAHEMGHQFGGNHTQNNSCNRNGPTAMEPGSASTIMGYAGICAPNVQNNSDDYFHAINLDEIASHVTGATGNSCPIATNTDNNPPTVSVNAGFYNVPVSTPFVLTAEGNDPDGNASLTYNWDQMDNEPATMPPVSTNTGGPAFRSLSPVESPSRYFPNLNAVLNGTTPTWEVLPSVSRLMNFRCTVRDNHPGGGCTAETDVTLSFTSAAGPFVVTQPNSAAVTWTSGSTATVTWNVAGTNSAPVNTSQVEIFLSIDGGLTYPYTLSDGTSNDGSQVVTVPLVVSNKARVMVKGRNNVFFDVSNQNFTIEEPTVPTFTLQADPPSREPCQNEEATYSLTLQSLAGFNESVSFTAAGLPAGASVNFSPGTLVPPGTVEIIIGNLNSAAPGTYPVTIEAQGLSVIQTTGISLIVIDSVSESTMLSAPSDGSTGLNPLMTLLTWDPVSAATGYAVEISTDPSFQSDVVTEFASGPELTLFDLTPETVYYWRVSGQNKCNDGPFSPASAFQTAGVTCQNNISDDVPVEISATSGGTVTSMLNVPLSGPVLSVDASLDISHTYVGDLKATLQSPSGTNILLFDRPGVPQSTYGCDQSNIMIHLSDNAPNTATDLENACNSSPLAISGDYQPQQPFTLVTGENSQGVWTLSVEDLYPQADGGAINSWDLNICTYTPITSALLVYNEPLLVILGQSEIISQDQLLADLSQGEVIFTLLSIPAHGGLYLNGNLLAAGGQFTQSDITNGLLSYEHNGSMTFSDSFHFDVLNSANEWLHDQVFQIQIVDNPVLGTTELSGEISCAGGDDGEITLSASGGDPPYQYSIDGISFQNDPVFGGLMAGSYELTIRDAIGRTLVLQQDVSEPVALTGSVQTNGYEITITASGGTGNLQFSIDNGILQSGNVFYPVAPGNHLVTIQDENGCQLILPATVDVLPLQAGLLLTDSLRCWDSQDAVLIVSVSGGIPPFIYSLNGGPFQNDPDFSGLSEGTYEVTVQDAGGISVTTPGLSITAPPVIQLNATVNGYDITADASGGTPPYEYRLDNGNYQASNLFTNLLNGTYTLTVRDINGCEASATTTLFVEPLQAIASISMGISCAGESDGIITIQTTGGIPPYQYSLNGIDFQPGNTFSGLSAGSYTPVVIDNYGNPLTVPPVVLQDPLPIAVTASAFGPDITVLASGGTGSLEYSLDGGPFQPDPQFEVVWNGTYTVQVRDENGCTAETAVVVNKPEVVFFMVTPASCADASDGKVIIEGVNGGYPPYMFSLNDGPVTSAIVYSGLSIGEYIFLVIDSTGYEWYAHPILIDAPPPLAFSVSSVSDTIFAFASGGTPPYRFSIDDGITFQDEGVFPGLSNGTYTLIVQDANGCEETATLTINVNAVHEKAASFGLEVFPNPGSGLFRLKTDRPVPDPLVLSVFNVAGQQVHQQTHSTWQQDLSIDLRSLANGTYMLQVTSGSFHGVERLVILR